MSSDIQNILELPKDALTLTARFLDLFSLNRFARTCKTFNSILLYEAFWEMYYYNQPWTIFAPKKEKIPTRKPNTTWKSTFIDFKNLVFDKFSVPIRGFNWAINEGLLPPKKEVWVQFLIANRGLLLNDQKIAEIMYKSFKSKEAFAQIFFGNVNVDLPLDWLIRKVAVLLRPVPNASPALAFDALAYEYTIRVIQATAPDDIKTYCEKIRAAISLLLNPANLGKQEFYDKMSQYLSCPELRRGADKFFENAKFTVVSISTANPSKRMFNGPLTWLTRDNQVVVHGQISNGVMTIYNNEAREILLAKYDFSEAEDLSPFRLQIKDVNEFEELTFSYNGQMFTSKSLKAGGVRTAMDAYFALYYNIVYPKLLPW